MSLVQYIVVRSDLAWPTGALIAQGCHASVAAIFRWNDREETREYLSHLTQMHKVVLAAESEESLINLSNELTKGSIDHQVWREEPEKILTAIASVPSERNKLKPFFKGFKLFK